MDRRENHNSRERFTEYIVSKVSPMNNIRMVFLRSRQYGGNICAAEESNGDFA